MAAALSAAQSAEFAELINEVARAPQNTLDATSIERMATWAVSAGAYTSRAEFIENFRDAPFRTLVDWALRGYYVTSLSLPQVAELGLIVDALAAAPNQPLDAALIERLLPLLASSDFLTNSEITKDMFGTYPYAALMAWAWWMNVLDATLPFNSWLQAPDRLSLLLEVD